MDFALEADLTIMERTRPSPRPVAHLELHTPDRDAASAFYASLLDWWPELIQVQRDSYVALDFGNGFGGGIVECGTTRPLWLPYVEVERIDDHTARASELGARVLLEPREGPGGWRSVISSSSGGEIAFWQPKR
jgi:predicted enzyme related to lactoylglutathione lyase